MNRLLKTSLVLVFFSFSMLLFQISCDNEAEANPSVVGDVKPLKLIFYFKTGSTGREELWSANYDGTGQRSLLALPENLNFIYEIVSVSPDGEKIFMTLNEASGNGENTSVYSVNIDGTNLQKIIPGTDGSGEVALAAVW